ncbi:Ig-like domain-containing protein [Paenibacillus sp. HB172176]|uniref:Ig-like domain-containing protein n=1 Tax=Paenibacillus sp. HB172176 TaxID=2493690 RepID=UPI00143A5406|nr:Ig-like domain-containing protein [Paenibacillus sp. HB172176]
MYKRVRGLSAILAAALLLNVYVSGFGLLGGTTTTVAAAGNSEAAQIGLLSNSGFETDLTGWSASGATIVRDTSEKHTGEASALVDRSTAYSGNIRQTHIAFEPGKTYYFSAWVKRMVGTGKVGLFVTQSGVKWNNANYPIMAIGNVDTEWTHIEGLQTFPTAGSDPASGYVYDDATVFVQHQQNDSAIKDEDGHYTDFYVDDFAAEPAWPSSLSVNGPATATIPVAGRASYAYSADVRNQLGTTAGLEDPAVVWSLEGSVAGVSVDSATGVLKVTDAASAGTVNIHAVAADNPAAEIDYAVTLEAGVPASEPLAPTASNVELSGLAKPGRMLTASYDYMDANGDAEVGSEYGWYVGDAANGAIAAIPGSTGTSYTVGSDQEGKYITFAVVPHAGVEPTVGEAVYSSSVLVTANAAPVAGDVGISGVQIIGQQLTGSYSFADEEGDSEVGTTYRWLQSDAAEGPYTGIEGATGMTLLLAPELEGKFVKFEVTPADAYSQGTAYASEPTEPIDEAARSAYYVDPVSGDDMGPGTEAEPFRTITKARDKVRAINGVMTSDITVYLGGGVYKPEYEVTEEKLYNQSGQNYATRQLKTSLLTFDERDSGQNGFNVIYTAVPGETPVISGGREIAGWTLFDADKNIYKASTGGDLDTRQLYVNGVRAVRARSEEGLTNAVKTASGYTTSDAFLADWGNIGDIEMVYSEKWTNPRCPVNSISASGGTATITMQQPCWYFASNKGGTSITVPWFYENAYELLDSPGEWYLDRSTDSIYYMPRAGEDMAAAEVVAPELEQLMEIKGAEPGTPVSHLAFSGITFAYNTWLRPGTDSGLSDAQNSHIRESGSGTGDWLGLAAVTLQNAHDIEFSGDTFTHLGSIALKTLEGSQDNLVKGNRFTDLSGTAIAIGEPSGDQKLTTDPQKLNRNNDVIDNYVYDIGIDYRSSAAISAGYPVDMDISHNEIGHAPYSGLHVGYGWASDPTSNTRNLKIQNNLIYDTMEQLVDGGPIYTLGRTGATVEEPNIVSGNYLLRNHSGSQGSLYFDEGSDYWHAYDNVMEDAPNYVFMWAQTIHDIVMDNTYTTTEKMVNNGTDTPITNTQVYEDANWPAEALGIIANAGLEPPYEHLRRDEPAEKLYLDDLSLSTGDSAQLEAKAILTHSGFAIDLDEAEIAWTSENLEVATIDSEGVVHAVGPGRATITATVNGQSVIVSAAVFVDDSISELTVTAEKQELMVGESADLEAEAITQYGRKFPISGLSFASSDSQIVSVNESGSATAAALGTATITATAEVEGELLSGSTVITVVEALAQDLIKDEDYWYLRGSTLTSGEGSVTIATPSGDAIFQGKSYGDELIRFEMQINGTSGWRALTFRNRANDQSYSSSSNELYMLLFTPGGIELHRFNKGQRTILYGALDGYTAEFGPAIPNDALTFGEEHEVEFGALNVEGGVRLVLRVDGETLIDAVDSGEGYLATPGFFGLYSRSGSITISAARSSLQAALEEAETLHDGAVEGGAEGQYPSGSKAAFAEAIAAAQAVYDDSAASQVDVDEAEAELEAAQADFESSKVVVNAEGLQQAIADASSLLDAAEEGTSPGQFMIGSKAVMSEAIAAAEAVLSGQSLSQSGVDEAAAELNASAAVFLCAVISAGGSELEAKAEAALSVYLTAVDDSDSVAYIRTVHNDFKPYIDAVKDVDGLTFAQRLAAVRNVMQLYAAEAIFVKDSFIREAKLLKTTVADLLERFLGGGH